MYIQVIARRCRTHAAITGARVPLVNAYIGETSLRILVVRLILLFLKYTNILK